MLAFEIWIDGERAAVAGVEDWSIWSFHLTAMREKTPQLETGNEIEASVGGMSVPDGDDISHHFRWGRRSLPIGSMVTVRVIESDSVDPPIKRYRSDRDIQDCPFTEEEMRQMRYDDFLRLKEEFERPSPTGQTKTAPPGD